MVSASLKRGKNVGARKVVLIPSPMESFEAAETLMRTQAGLGQSMWLYSGRSKVTIDKLARNCPNLLTSWKKCTRSLIRIIIDLPCYHCRSYPATRKQVLMASRGKAKMCANKDFSCRYPQRLSCHTNLFPTSRFGQVILSRANLDNCLPS